MGERHFRRAVAESVEHYHGERDVLLVRNGEEMAAFRLSLISQ